MSFQTLEHWLPSYLIPWVSFRSFITHNQGTIKTLDSYRWLRCILFLVLPCKSWIVMFPSFFFISIYDFSTMKSHLCPPRLHIPYPSRPVNHSLKSCQILQNKTKLQLASKARGCKIERERSLFKARNLAGSLPWHAGARITRNL